MIDSEQPFQEIGIIGLSVRAPGIETPQQFWTELLRGSDFLDRTVREEQGRPVVSIKSEVPNWEEFDAPFFNLTPTEVRLMDPQQRLLLEMSWEAFEDAGIRIDRTGGDVGVFTATSFSRYLLEILDTDLLRNNASMRTLAQHGCYADYAASRIAYSFDFHGPAMSVGTACSSSLSAISIAVDALRDKKCDLALVGASNIRRTTDYDVEEGGIHSPEGYCRPFDARANGTVPGQGGGVVLLKRLIDAERDGDRVYASITAKSVNNDGNRKAGYAAPSVDGQIEAMRGIFDILSKNNRRVSFVEAHGTGTRIGDPIEIAAIKKAYSGHYSGPERCVIGSVKSNVGHLDSAAGIMGLIKTTLALYYKKIPPTVHFRAPNPLLEMEQSSFRVNLKTEDWITFSSSPRCALVCSLGIGGTNAYVALQEANPAVLSGVGTNQLPSLNLGDSIAPISAKNEKSAERAVDRLTDYIGSTPGIRTVDICRSLQYGRVSFDHRRAILFQEDRGTKMLSAAPAEGLGTCFLFPGQGAAVPGGILSFIDAVPQIRKAFEKCVRYLEHEHGIAVLAAIKSDTVKDIPLATALLQPVLFAVEFAIADALVFWRIMPSALIGHSLGELAALCVAGAMPLHAALDLVVKRGEVMARAPEGRMLAIKATEGDLRGRFDIRGLSIAALNGPSEIVLSGPSSAIEQLKRDLSKENVPAVDLVSNHAFHSSLMSEAAKEFASFAARRSYAEPKFEVISSTLGRRFNCDDLYGEDYWRRNIDDSVRFHDACQSAAETCSLFIECGPGSTLTRLVQNAVRSNALSTNVRAVAVTGQKPSSNLSDVKQAIGLAWVHGCNIDWERLSPARDWSRVSLPTYSFQRKHYSMIHERGPTEPRAAPRETTVVPTKLLSKESQPCSVKRAFEIVLGVEITSETASFFDLGGDSLASVALLNEISALKEGAITVAEFLDDPTVRGVKALLAKRSPKSARETAEQRDDTQTEITFTAGQPIARVNAPQTDQTVLLTGATGFLGAHLLRGLLDRSYKTVTCVIRAESPDRALGRLRAAMNDLGLWRPEDAARIEIVIGDLSESNAGLNPAMWEALADRIDHIVHSGAAVNHIYPYDKLYNVNVGSTVDFLRLAAKTKAKRFHLMSTYAVFDSEEYHNYEVITEAHCPDILPPFDRGYSRTKAVAEQVTQQAIAQGVPAAIYRLPNISGHTIHGICNLKDSIWAFVKSMVMLEAVPEIVDLDETIALPMSPANSIADAIIELMETDWSAGRRFHVFPERKVPLKTFVDHLRYRGYDLGRVSQSQWRSRVAAKRKADKSANAYLWVFDGHGDFRRPFRATFDVSVLKSNGGAKVPTSPSAADIDKYIAVMGAMKFLPQPIQFTS
ncbi:type I polyketide synthase [Agrobacterium rhizogenes]|uniref:Polyketide synthase n=1 Tax=Rhizobium rhizogenes NBRC 13257 TaxID=1220581 RepID=A0AA87Q8Y1_RHIRH|nr:type I polyketide synthase [Rhizobium rhizogenes]OCJ27270.1 hypothetical protein A6U89_29260 [Agrobacterium sp. B133/95]NTG71531.1 type I polyketide synthase [Rhizobium rhizogenes]NTG90626.1 type I polyketide synthase [Rhizobium rhizogenes]NTI52847.1 type I polyketide synthase [Rhizobium rhizogenes]NTI98220.1 type I polyketide synthase [Rhizobium rhizogenes]